MNHEHNIVKKPWGYEYLAYENDNVAIWLLYIKQGESTSMHCHPNKTTGLACLGGKGVVSFLSNNFPLNAANKLMIRKGLFHSTKSVSLDGCHILEIETPVKKTDLVRFKDNYGREGKPYEDSTFEYPKVEECVWIEKPKGDSENIYQVGECSLRVCSVRDVAFFEKIDNKNVIFLDGGIMTEYNINVASPGDIVHSETLKELINVFKKIDENTMVMIMEKNA
jgi:mannose-6-phosphate isomerase-like protein (cupin superfamily)